MPSRYQSIISSEIIGRDCELHTLKQAVRTIRQGTGRCILLSGEAGIGKSRLVTEICQQAMAEQFVILQGHCFQQDLPFPYGPWIDALRTFFAPLSGLDIETLLGPLASEFVKLLPEMSLLIPQVRPSPTLDPEEEKRRLFEVITRFGTNLTESNPLLVVLEDLHWSDELSLELLHYFVRRITNRPILLIGTYRSEEPSPRLTYHFVELNRERLIDEVRLAPLTRQGVEQLVCSLLKVERPIPADLLDLVAIPADGNPFFVEEVVKTLVEAGDVA